MTVERIGRINPANNQREVYERLLTPEEDAERQAIKDAAVQERLASLAARNRLKAALTDVPVTVNSIPELREKVDDVVMALREHLGVDD